MINYAILFGVFLFGLAASANLKGLAGLVGGQMSVHLFRLKLRPAAGRAVHMGRIVGSFLALVAALAAASSSEASESGPVVALVYAAAVIAGLGAPIAVWWLSRPGRPLNRFV